MRTADHSDIPKTPSIPTPQHSRTEQHNKDTCRNSKRSTSRIHYSINIYWAPTSEHFRTAKVGRLARGPGLGKKPSRLMTL